MPCMAGALGFKRLSNGWCWRIPLASTEYVRNCECSTDDIQVLSIHGTMEELCGNQTPFDHPNVLNPGLED